MTDCKIGAPNAYEGAPSWTSSRELFCTIDDFCQQFEPILEHRVLDEGRDQSRRHRECAMSLSEMTTITVLFDTLRKRQSKKSHQGIERRKAFKSYADREFAQKMKVKGIDVITRLRKCSPAETVFDELKKLCQIEHIQHRPGMNFAVNLMAGIVAYCLQPAKQRIAAHCRRGFSGSPGRELTHFVIQNSG